jgi:IclR family transcriptional regulator, pca regulon regulatory protein
VAHDPEQPQVSSFGEPAAVAPASWKAEARGRDQFLKSFAKGLSVIRTFGPDARSMTLSEVAAKAGLTRAGARRVLLTLHALGYVGCDGRDFSLTPRILDLGYSYLSTTPLWDLAEPFMEQLVAEVHESCSASVLDGAEIVYIVRIPTKKIMAINLSIASRLPAFCTSMGRVLLGGLSDAELDRVLAESPIKAYTSRTVTEHTKLKAIIAEDRARGFSLVNQELEDGLLSASVPLHGRNGRVIAAMNVSGQSTRTSPSEVTRNIVPALKRCAARIESALRFRSDP